MPSIKILRPRRLRRACACGLLPMLLTACSAAPPADPPPQVDAVTDEVADGRLHVHFLDVGQGDATLLVAPDAVMLIDTGRHHARDVVTHLQAREVETIDVVAVTHPHADHLGQFDRVLEAFEVLEVWWTGNVHTTQTFERALAALEASSAAYEEPRAGDRTTVGSLGVEVLNPVELTGDLHDDSLVLRVTFGSVRFLFTGDAEGPTEERLVADRRARLAAEVYQVGHHGSGTSTTPAFLTAVSPVVAVYSAGAGNPYGHPHDQVIARLEAAGVSVYGTDGHGTVTVTTDGRTFEVTTTRSPDATDGKGAP